MKNAYELGYAVGLWSRNLLARTIAFLVGAVAALLTVAIGAMVGLLLLAIVSLVFLLVLVIISFGLVIGLGFVSFIIGCQFYDALWTSLRRGK